jgi:HAD superfamily hydrolase (TIGR01509 family)
MTLDALIFDVDGTIADTEETHRQAFNAAFIRFELGWDWSPQRYAGLLAISGGAERIAHYIDTLGLPASERSRLQGIVPGIHAAKTRLFTELIADGRSPLRPGVARLIDEAQGAGVRVAIASTTTGANVEALLSAHLGRDAYRRFAVIACGDQVQAKKPAPDLYQLVLGALHLPPAACVAFEDSANGVRAAKAAGLYTVATPTAWTAAQDLSAADLVLPSLGDPGAPLAPALAAAIGGPFLTLKELERRLRAAARVPDAA